jgi:uncharacterized protein
MTFWDTSALVPLFCEEPDSARREAYLAGDPMVVVWYGTVAEVESAFCRRMRDGSLAPEDAAMARNKAQVISNTWMEVEPTVDVRQRAIRLLRVHSLRTADAFQLAAALLVCQERPTGHHFLTSDARLADAARLEGFLVE